MSDLSSNAPKGFSSCDTSFWSPLDLGIIKVNFDEYFIHDRLVAGAGVVMRKDDGSFLFAWSSWT